MLFCINFTQWKKGYIHTFLSSQGEPVFVSSAEKAVEKGFNENSQLVTWASKELMEVEKLVDRFGVSPWFVEDGFIRSTGLGTDLTAPASLVIDKTGIYYDSTQPSDLEKILLEKEFTVVELARAEKLKKALITNELSKYNVGTSFTKDSIDVKPDQKIILIPGQVEDDASIKKGCVDVNSNAALIESVKKNNREAFVIYKPHPDVVSGNRKGEVSDQILTSYVDHVLYDASITDCLDVSDEVHTMTSLVGFEAIMRGLRVVCYGLPFYSNWGLTKDKHVLSRRTRKLSLNALIAGTLIDYPRYVNWETKQLTTPEVIVELLKQQIDAQGGKQPNQVSVTTRASRKVLNFLKGALRLN